MILAKTTPTCSLLLFEMMIFRNSIPSGTEYCCLIKRPLEFREAHVKSLNQMEELKRFQGSTFDGISRRRLIEDRDTILELTAKIQELQNEVNCMNDLRYFKDAESVRSGQSHVISQPAFFLPFLDPGGMLSRSLGMPSRND